jgi:hypothetical protein
VRCGLDLAWGGGCGCWPGGGLGTGRTGSARVVSDLWNSEVEIN